LRLENSTTKAIQSATLIEKAKTSVEFWLSKFRQSLPNIILHNVPLTRFGCFFSLDYSTYNENLAVIWVNGTTKVGSCKEHWSTVNFLAIYDFYTFFVCFCATHIKLTSNKENSIWVSGQTYHF
jgi:hypothetical protein